MEIHFISSLSFLQGRNCICIHGLLHSPIPVRQEIINSDFFRFDCLFYPLSSDSFSFKAGHRTSLPSLQIPGNTETSGSVYISYLFFIHSVSVFSFSLRIYPSYSALSRIFLPVFFGSEQDSSHSSFIHCSSGHPHCIHSGIQKIPGMDRDRCSRKQQGH